MTIQHDFFRNPDYLHLRLDGQVTAEGYFRHFAELAEDDAFYPAIPTLIELGPNAEIAVGDMDMKEAERMGEVIGRVRAGTCYRIAIAEGPPDTHAFVAMAQRIVSDRSEANAFESVSEARRWLLSPDDATTPHSNDEDDAVLLSD